MMGSAVETKQIQSAVEASALVCTAGRARIGIPAPAVFRIVEYQVASPLPLAHALVGGLGVCEGRPLISLSLSSAAGDRIERARRVKGVLLHTQGTGIDWAIEVLEVGTFATVRRVRLPTSDRSRLPRWVTLGETSDGYPLGWLDVTAMIDDLSARHGLGA